MNKIGVLIVMASISCGIVTSITLKVLSNLFGCHSVKKDYLLKSKLLNVKNAKYDFKVVLSGAVVAIHVYARMR
jgi:hypothetical protein